MLKRLLMLTGAALILITSGSACIPEPPCFPRCVVAIPPGL
jgi:hypothetical protein